MIRWQFTTRSLVLTISLVACYFAAARLYDNWFESLYSGYASTNRLARLQDGLPLSRVTAHYATSRRLNQTDLIDLGPTQAGKILQPGGFSYASQSLIKMLQGMFEKMEPGDEIYSFKDRNGRGAFLRFRDGLLINHDPTLYQPSIQLAKLNGQPWPVSALRNGILPYYLPLALLLIYIDYRLQRRVKRRTPREMQSVSNQGTV